MWIYIVIFLFIRDIPVECPNGLIDCKVNHVRRDTIRVGEWRYCEKEPALIEYQNRCEQEFGTFYETHSHWNAVKLDSLKVSNERTTLK